MKCNNLHVIVNFCVNSEASVRARKEILVHEIGRNIRTIMSCHFFLSSLSSLGLTSPNVQGLIILLGCDNFKNIKTKSGLTVIILARLFKKIEIYHISYISAPNEIKSGFQDLPEMGFSALITWRNIAIDWRITSTMCVTSRKAVPLVHKASVL